MSGLAIASPSDGPTPQPRATSSVESHLADHQLDTSLPTALAQLVHRLTQPLSVLVPHAPLLDLREALRQVLYDKYAPTWDEELPMRGSGYRSLICQKDLGLPAELRTVARQFNLEPSRWIRALALTKNVEGIEVVTRSEWEAWCDPGVVAWRYGSWEWEDVGFEPTRPVRGECVGIGESCIDELTLQIPSRSSGKLSHPLRSGRRPSSPQPSPRLDRLTLSQSRPRPFTKSHRPLLEPSSDRHPPPSFQLSASTSTKRLLCMFKARARSRPPRAKARRMLSLDLIQPRMAVSLCLGSSSVDSETTRSADIDPAILAPIRPVRSTAPCRTPIRACLNS